jgi:D-serine deaminase-like pyridoxal phosphate-dependent protein
MSTAAPRDYDFYRGLLRGRPMPLAFVDLDLFDANVAAVVERAGGKQVRAASKSIRSVRLLQRVLAAHPSFRGALCYSATEAVHLAKRGIADLVVGYPIWGAAEVREVCAAAAEGHPITLMIDCAEHAERIGALASECSVSVPVCLDVDMSSSLPGLYFGVRRSPLRTVQGVLALVEAIERQKHLRLDGVMGYEAQIAGVQDDVPGRAARSWLVRQLKRRSIAEVAERRAAVVDAIRQRGHSLRFVNGGGTGSLETTRLEACVTELAAGSAFFSPVLFDGYRRFHHLPAAGFAIEVTRRPAPGIFTCSGGGYVASGPGGPDRMPQPYLPEGARLLPNEGAGEVQTPVSHVGPQPLALGDPVLLRHAKAGELCERFSSLLLVSQDQVRDEIPTYRGEGWCFL